MPVLLHPPQTAAARAREALEDALRVEAVVCQAQELAAQMRAGGDGR
jgi:hypothetical protein